MTVVSTMLSVEPLRPTDPDFGAFGAALTAEQLPTDDVAEAGRAFFRVTEANETIGFGGYELHGEDALLRSLTVPPDLRGRGLGRLVAEAVLRAAAGAGARHVWLLTTTAGPFFERLGFVRIDRATAPEAIRSTRQATSLCPSSAALMVRPLDP